MTWERYFFGPRLPIDPPILWTDWAQLGASYVGYALLVVLVVWLFRQSMRDVARRPRAAEIDEKSQYITGAVSALRLLLTRRVL